VQLQTQLLRAQVIDVEKRNASLHGAYKYVVFHSEQPISSLLDLTNRLGIFVVKSVESQVSHGLFGGCGDKLLFV